MGLDRRRSFSFGKYMAPVEGVNHAPGPQAVSLPLPVTTASATGLRVERAEAKRAQLEDMGDFLHP